MRSHKGRATHSVCVNSWQKGLKGISGRPHWETSAHPSSIQLPTCLVCALLSLNYASSCGRKVLGLDSEEQHRSRFS